MSNYMNVDIVVVGQFTGNGLVGLLAGLSYYQYTPNTYVYNTYLQASII